MVVSTFSVFVDTVTPPPPTSIPSKSLRKPQRAHEVSDATTKENINPLTGEFFDSQPPLKKRKPSTTTVLKSKAVASSSKTSSKSSKSLPGKDRKEKGKRRKLVALEGTEKQEPIDSAVSSITTLGNRRSYEFTVMPLADVTQAYDESEAYKPFHIVTTLSESKTETPEMNHIDTTRSSALPQNNNEMDTLSSKEVINPEVPLLIGSDA